MIRILFPGMVKNIINIAGKAKTVMRMEQEYKYYETLSARLKEERKTLRKSFSVISALRLVCFCLAAGLIAVGISDRHLIAGIMGIVLIIVFFVLVYKHSRVFLQIGKADATIDVAQRYIDRFGENWHGFPDNGGQFMTACDAMAYDVDLLGAGSLYQMINVCHTEKGKMCLSDELRLKNVQADNINRRYEAVSELVEKRDFGIEFETLGIVSEKNRKKPDVDEFKKYCSDASSCVLPAWCRVVMIFLPLAEIILLMLWIFQIVNYGLPLIGFIFNLSFTWLTKSVTDKIIYPVFMISNAAGDYTDMMRSFASQQFESKLLKELQSEVTNDDGVICGLSKLSKIVQAYNISFNPIVHQILSGILLWDYQLAYFVSRWKKRYGKASGNCFDIIARLEMLLSLSVLGKVRKCSFAQIEHNCEKVFVEGENIYHPLINPKTSVSNNASLRGGVTVITGSNMSGKTTFLRTVAINLVLAYIGAPVCAKAFRASFMKIFTSMRITDDIAGGISTFYAEILRIKSMADFKKQNQPMICLVDEIFKGTNSADRIVGAKHVIKCLGSENCIALVSTHDFELCTLTDGDGQEAENYHFEEFYEGDQLKFDYKIKSGRCTTTNAREILRMAGFDVQD